MAQLFLRAPGEKRRPPAGMTAEIHLDEPGRSGYPLHHDLAQLLAAPQLPGEAAQTFLLAALGVWAADKLLPRREAPDAWTREIILHLPAADPWSQLAPDLSPPPELPHRRRLDPQDPPGRKLTWGFRAPGPRPGGPRRWCCSPAAWTRWWAPSTCWSRAGAWSW